MDSQCTSVRQKDKSIGSMLMFTELNEVRHQSNNIIINKLNFINMIIALAYIFFFVTVIIIIIIITTTIIIIIIINYYYYCGKYYCGISEINMNNI